MVNTTNTDVASQISNKKYTVLTSTWYNGDWINMADTNQRNNMQEVLNGVGQQVKQAQVEIKTATNQASDAMSSASATIESSKINSQAIIAMNSATSEAKSDAANAFDQAKSAMSAATSNSSALKSQSVVIDSAASQVALKADQTAVDTLKDTVTANSAAISVQADEIKQKVTSSDVQGLLNSGGYATQTWTSGQLELAANKFSLNLSALQTQVDNSAVGTNLLTGTSSGYKTVPDSVTIYAGGLVYTPSSADITNIGGQTITIRTYIKNTTAIPVALKLYFNKQFFNGNNVDANSEGYSTITATLPLTSSSGVDISIRGNGATSGVQYKEFKLEKGSVATDWCPNPADNATVTSVTNLEATVDGLQTTVSNKVNAVDYNSKITQLSNLIDSKVSTADYNAEVAILANDIDLKVAKGDVVSQINQEAGGNTLIQVASGKGKLYLDAATTVFGGTAFISDAMITSLSADKISGGTIDGKLISANALNVALDNWSSNLQLAPNGLTIINGGITALQMDYSGLALFDPTTNTSVGKIHGAAYDNAKNPGLAFDLDTHGDFMAWTVQDDASEGYNSKLLWTRDDLASKLNIQYGFHVSDNITFHGNIYPEDATHADASHVHFQDITVNGARGFGIVNDLGCGIVICDNKTVWAVKQTNGTATQILG